MDLKVIGGGGTSTIYRARSRPGGPFIVLKVPREPNDARTRRQFADEIETTAELQPIDPKVEDDRNWRYVVKYLGHGVIKDDNQQWTGRPYLKLEYLDRGSVRDRLRHGKLDWQEACRLVAGGARGAAWLHKTIRWIHGDIKPENLFLGRNGVKLGDFGSCRRVGGGSLFYRLLGAGRREINVSPGYADPCKNSGFFADVFSLGVVLCECLTGLRPAEIDRYYTSDGIQLPVDWGHDRLIPDPVWSICTRCIGPVYTRPSAAELAKELEEVVADRYTQVDTIKMTESELYTRPPRTSAASAPAPNLVTGGLSRNRADLDTSAARRRASASRIQTLYGLLPYIVCFSAAIPCLVVLVTAQRTTPSQPAPQTVRTVPDGEADTDLPQPDAMTDTEADRSAADAVLAIGGKVRVDNMEVDISDAAALPPTPFLLTGITLTNNPRATDGFIATLINCRNLKSLYLDRTRVTDVGLNAMGIASKNLTHIDLYGTQVGDVGVARFKDCAALMYLQLGRTNVTDAGLLHFGTCTRLRWVGLEGTQVSDAGLTIFQENRGLQTLDLLLTNKVSDAGLLHLKDCKGLYRLVLTGTGVTSKGIAAFQKERVRCEIVW